MPSHNAPHPEGSPKRRVHEHPAYDKAIVLKDINRETAHRFLRRLWRWLIGASVIWLLLHLFSSEAIVRQMCLYPECKHKITNAVVVVGGTIVSNGLFLEGEIVFRNGRLVTNYAAVTNGVSVGRGIVIADGKLVELTNATALGPPCKCRFNPFALLAWLRMDPTNSVELDSAGRVAYLSETDLRWYIGRDQASATAAALKERTRRIDELQDRIIQQSLLEFRVRFSGEGLNRLARDQVIDLENFARSDDFAGAAEKFTSIVQGWSDETRKKVGEKAIFELNFGLANLARLKREQLTSLGVNLQPPRMHQIFWSSPVGALSEAMFWSLLGTLVNLIVNVSQARTGGRFRGDEVWVSYSKLIYGPVLSFVLILTIYFGILNAGTEMRFWLLPLLGFIFGYNTRKVAMLIDRLSERFFSSVGKSMNEIGKIMAAGAAHGAAAVQAEAKPRTVPEIRQMADRVLHSAVVAATLKQQKDT